MANFLEAYSKMIVWEGGFVDDPLDRGGTTYRGLTRKNNPNWAGWSFVDKSMPLKRGEVIKNERLEGMVQAHYLNHYWYNVQGDKINNQAIATFLFDWYVNSGCHAVKALQQVIGSTADGVMGPETVAAVNSGCQEDIFNKFKAARESFYRGIVARNPTQQKFLAGWLNRNNSFTFE